MSSKDDRWRTVGDRLRWAIEDYNYLTIKAVNELIKPKLKERKVRGVSHQSINDYLHDKVTPRIDFLAVAAEVLDVRVEWMAFKSGEPTVAEEIRAAEARSKTPLELIGALGTDGPDDLKKFRKSFNKRCSWYDMLTPTIQLEFDNIFARYVKHISPRLAAPDRLMVADALAKCIVAPFDLRGSPATWDDLDFARPEFTDYTWAMLHALGLAMNLVRITGNRD
jgi:hypothetical protein